MRARWLSLEVAGEAAYSDCKRQRVPIRTVRYDGEPGNGLTGALPESLSCGHSLSELLPHEITVPHEIPSGAPGRIAQGMGQAGIDIRPKSRLAPKDRWRRDARRELHHRARTDQAHPGSPPQAREGRAPPSSPRPPAGGQHHLRANASRPWTSAMGAGGVVGPGRARGLSPRLAVLRARSHGRQNPPEAPTGPPGAAVWARGGGARKGNPYE